MFTSLRSRLWLTYFILIAVILGVIAVSLFFYLLRNPVLYRQTVQHLKVSVTAITLRADLLEPYQGERLQRALAREDALLNVRVQILDADGNVLADSRKGTSRELKKLARPLTPQTDAQDQPNTIRDTSGTVWLYRLGEVDSQHYVLVAVPRPKVAVANILRDEFALLMTRTGALALLVAILLGILMAHWISAPLQHIAAAARSAAAGKFQVIPLEGPQEVQDLARSFNSMTHQVQINQQSQRDLVANVSHELKTPLTSIQGFAQAILDGTASSPEALHQAAQVISGEASRMARLVMDLLTLARLEAGTANLRRIQVDLEGLARGLVDRMTPQAKQASVSLQLDLQPPIPWVMGDPDRLEQVLANLVDNAIKFTPAGGQVTLSAQAGRGFADIHVADTGPGMPTEVQARIFERFYQVDPSRKGSGGRGSGLGLAIARELVAAQGGTIQVISSPGKGSTFVVKLPATAAAEQPVLQHHPSI